MSEDSSVRVDQPQPRNAGLGRQVNDNEFDEPPIARRTLIIPNQTDVLNVDVSMTSRQGFYVVSGRGNVSQATLVSLPYRLIQTFTEDRDILYMSGWFQPIISTNGDRIISSRRNGILHICLPLRSWTKPCHSYSQLIADGPVEFKLLFSIFFF
ncbi:hypothetical protein CARUB_v10006737mg [Capsella rubella]|uniref:Uncharacterized protein n=1 Tax=Capsella rubella TaxID=81985 RepID=R0H0V4_9BRAS|nr:hypothetical protein CARUB_v10006737mg [Capsella rubella]